MCKHSKFIALGLLVGALACGIFMVWGVGEQRETIWYMNDKGQMVTRDISTRESAEIAQALASQGYSNAKDFAKQAQADADAASRGVLWQRVMWGGLGAGMLAASGYFSRQSRHSVPATACA